MPEKKYQLEREILIQLANEPSQFGDILAEQLGVPPEQLRIQAGRKIIYGQLASGEWRNQIDRNYLDQLISGMEKGASVNEFSPRKIPEFSIQVRGEPLFRQERDGTVSLNQVQLDLGAQKLPEREFTVADADLDKNSIFLDSAEPESEAEGLLAAAQFLNQEYGSILLEDKVNKNIATLAEDDNLSEEITQLLPAAPQVFFENEAAFLEVRRHLDDWQPKPDSVASKEFVSQVVESAHSQYQVGRSILEELGQAVQKVWDYGKSLPEQINNVAKSQAFQAKVEQIKDSVSAKVIDLGNWIANRPEAIATDKLMEETFAKFTQGHERTLESEYRVGNFQIVKQGPQLISLKQGDDTLLQFKVENQLVGGNRLTLKEKNSDSIQVLKELRQQTEVVGSASAEAERSQRIEAIAAKVAKIPLGSSLPTRSQRYQLNREGQLERDGKQVELTALNRSDLINLSRAVARAYGQQQTDRCIPVLAKHLNLIGGLREETPERLVQYDPDSRLLSYQSLNNEQEHLSARYVDNGIWRYESGELTPAKEEQIGEALRLQHEEYAAQQQQLTQNTEANSQEEEETIVMEL